jgi:3'-phosphoadenosine 5'-phosphosulfate sulfotransferase (PAPS reductase)/FAD synthetase
MSTNKRAQWRALSDRGAVFFCSHSGGKDSQAMYSYLRRIGIPHDQLVVVHANLGEVEWPGVIKHIERNIEHRLHVVKAGKTLLEMVERRHESRPDVPPWPSPKHRQCTSDLKRGPIQKFIRHELKRRGVSIAVNCMGLRAEESSARAKRPSWVQNKALSKAGREVWDWLPIQHWPVADVWAQIKQANQEPFHAYKSGNERLSCMFCIMGCEGDLRNAAAHNPALAAKYIELEERTGFTMFPSGPLAEKLAGALKPRQAEEPAQMELGL